MGGEHAGGRRPIVWTTESSDEKYQKYNTRWPKMAADRKFYTQQPTKNMRKQSRRERVGGESGADHGGSVIPSFWGQYV